MAPPEAASPEAVLIRVLLAAASYAALFVLLLWQTLRGQSVVAFAGH